MFDRLVNHHKLNNLVWLWNVDRPSTPARKFSNFYVGNDYFDIASLDVYGSDFNQHYYDSLLALAKGKPVVLGEVGNPPTPQIIKRQPKWSYYVIWAGMVRNTFKKEYKTLMNDSPRALPGRYGLPGSDCSIQSGCRPCSSLLDTTKKRV